MNNTIRCLLVFLLAITLTAPLYANEAPEPLDASLEILQGQVKLTRVGTSRSDVISEPCQLYSGDLIETLRDSKAVLKYSDGTEMRLKERTLLEVAPMSVRVFKGRTWYNFTKRGTQFKIETPTLVAGIRGTHFEVAVSSRNKAAVSVFEGAVEVRGSQKGALVLRPGFAAHADASGNLSAPYKFDAERHAQDWTSAEWTTENKMKKINMLFLKYINIKNEYGENDSRTLEAKEALRREQNRK